MWGVKACMTLEPSGQDEWHGRGYGKEVADDGDEG